jgi:polyisoprenyl-phosphate glycosyltransferase
LELANLALYVMFPSMARPRYSFVIPIYNEEEMLPELHRQLNEFIGKLDGETEVVLIDDGSRDASWSLMLDIQANDPRFKLIRLSRNFGHQIAISSGIDKCTGDATIIIDADLQDPLETVLDMIKKWKEGNHIVYGLRESRAGETWFKLATATLFYKILNQFTDVKMPNNVGDFRLVDRKALEAFKALPERSRYVRGMFTWVGFKQVGVSYQRHERFAGETKYPFRKMFKLAKNAIISFSTSPLNFALTLGFGFSGAAFLAALWAFVLKLTGAYTVAGWTSLTIIVAFLGGAQLVVIGILGEYVGRIYDEVKGRPLYFVSEERGFNG